MKSKTFFFWKKKKALFLKHVSASGEKPFLLFPSTPALYGFILPQHPSLMLLLKGMLDETRGRPVPPYIWIPYQICVFWPLLFCLIYPNLHYALANPFGCFQGCMLKATSPSSPQEKTRLLPSHLLFCFHPMNFAVKFKRITCNCNII